MKRTPPWSRYLLATFTCLGLLAAAGCTAPTGDASDPAAISNRPQNIDRFIAIVKLKSPSLLASSQKVDGKVVIDADAKAALLAEQDATIAELEALSPGVKVLYRYKMVLNAVAVVAPKALEEKFRQFAGVAYVEKEAGFAP